jgi:hypothetical protein
MSKSVATSFFHLTGLIGALAIINLSVGVGSFQNHFIFGFDSLTKVTYIRNRA